MKLERGEQVIGELYQINDEKLAQLDCLEHTDHVLGYKRIEIKIQSIEKGVLVHSFTYAKKRKYVADISSQYLSEYTDRKYIPMKMRKDLI